MEIRKKAAWPVWFAGAAWCLYGLLFPFYRLTDILIATALAVLTFLITDKIAKPIVIKLPAEAALGKTGNDLADAVISAGKAHLARLAALGENLQNQQMRGHVEELTAISRQIFKFVAENPDSARQLNRFMDYYFPEAVKLVDTYASLEAGPTKTEQILKSMLRIEASSAGVATVFKNQLDSLYADKALDIKTDIEVLEQVLKRDGLDK